MGTLQCRMTVLVRLMLVVAVMGMAAAATKPNILFILLDDMGYEDLGVMGSSDVKSPNIDRLANGGAKMKNGYSMATFCSPARAGALTGINPARYGHFYNPYHTMYDTKMGLPANLTLLPQTLRKAGYRTMAIGKWHLGFSFLHHPLNRGFHKFFGFLGGKFTYWSTRFAPPGGGSIEHLYDQFDIPESVKYLTSEFTDRAMDFISDSNSRDMPFFLYLAYNAPHSPYEFRPHDVDPLVSPERQPHVAMLKSVDTNIGRIYWHLSRLRILDKTLIVVTNDNGGHKDGAINFPLRDYKGSWLEGGVRVPFFLYWQGTIQPGQEIDDAISLIDLYPTFEEVAQVAPSDRNPGLEGKDIMPYLARTGEAAPILHGPIHDQIILGSKNSGAVRRGRYKIYVKYKVLQGFFDLKEDVSETTDLKDVEPYKTMGADMHEEFKRWRKGNSAEAFPRKPVIQPLGVTMAGPTSTLMMGVEYTFVSTAEHSEGLEFNYSYEFFRPKKRIQADFRTLKHSKVVARFSEDGSEAFVTFQGSGYWVVRVNVFDGRFIKWYDMDVTVSRSR